MYKGVENFSKHSSSCRMAALPMWDDGPPTKWSACHAWLHQTLGWVDKDVKDMTLAEVQGLKIQQDGHTSHIPSWGVCHSGQELKMPLCRACSLQCRNCIIMWLLFAIKDEGARVEKDHPTILDLSVMEEAEKKSPEIKTGYVIRFSLVNLKMP